MPGRPGIFGKPVGIPGNPGISGNPVGISGIPGKLGMVGFLLLPPLSALMDSVCNKEPASPCLNEDMPGRPGIFGKPVGIPGNPGISGKPVGISGIPGKLGMVGFPLLLSLS